MTNLIDVAKQQLLKPAGLTESQLQKVLSDVLGHTVDDADLYFQSTGSESWVLEDGIVKEGSYHIERGVGVRAMAGEKTGFAYSDDILLPSLTQAASVAKCIAHRGEAGIVKTSSHITTGHALYPAINPLDSLSKQEKIDLLKKIDAEARRQDPRVIQVIVSLSGSQEVVMILDGEGKLAADIRPMVRFNVSVVVEEKGHRERGTAGGGGRTDYRFFIDEEERALGYAREAVRQALVNLEALDAPAGTMPVVLGPGWPGVLLHEAIGHGLEGDFNRKGTSAFTGRIGERVATPHCTVVDDGTLEGHRGSLNIDDEGKPTQRNVLIEDGILKGYMHDKLNARLMKTKSTGNGRRESYASMPIPRMTNTFMFSNLAE